MDILIVGLGGAIGAMGRYGLSLFPFKTTFPAITLLTNFLGSVIIGFIVGFASARGISERWLLFWKTGVCGGFTTFSTFSLETLTLLQNRQYFTGGLYMLLSVGLCLLGTALGQYVACRISKA